MNLTVDRSLIWLVFLSTLELASAHAFHTSPRAVQQPGTKNGSSKSIFERSIRFRIPGTDLQMEVSALVPGARIMGQSRVHDFLQSTSDTVTHQAAEEGGLDQQLLPQGIFNDEGDIFFWLQPGSRIHPAARHLTFRDALIVLGGVNSGCARLGYHEMDFRVERLINQILPVEVGSGSFELDVDQTATGADILTSKRG